MDAPPNASGKTVLTCGQSSNIVLLISVVMALLVVAAVIAIGAQSLVATIIVFALMGGALFFLVPRVKEVRSWHDPELHLPEYPLTLGSSSEVRFVRRPKVTGSDHGGAPIAARFTLECEERATYRQGTDTRTDTSTVHKHVWTANGAHHETASIGTQLNVPDDHGAPTFDLGNNEVRWTLEIEPTGSSFPNSKASYTLDVAPVWAGGAGQPTDSTPRDAGSDSAPRPTPQDGVRLDGPEETWA